MLASPTRRLAALLLGACSLGSVVACNGAQQGYYDACAEPAGLALGCDAPDDDELTAWDACTKLARCGVILVQDEDDDNPDMPPIFDVCVDRIEATYADLGDTVIACIDDTQCPDLVGIEPVDDDDPDASAPQVEGVIGYCGRLHPQ